jgi:hypothetical protein
VTSYLLGGGCMQGGVLLPSGRRQHGYEHPKVIFPPGAVDRSVISMGAASLGLS